MSARYSVGEGGGVVFLTEREGRHTLRALVAANGGPPIGAIDSWRAMLAPSFRARALVICDAERRDPLAEERLVEVIAGWRAGAPDLPVLNAPPRVMRRYELARRLYLDGRNRGNCYRLDDPATPDAVRFPCFVREEAGHNVNRGAPELLADRAALDRALAALDAQGRTRFGKILVEFEDNRNEDGYYTKYSYFRVGDDVFPAHRFVGSVWYLKDPDRALIAKHPSILQREREFVESDPHREEISELFALAGIDYGRIDYSVRADGTLQIFEINTNPNIPYTYDERDPRRELKMAAQARLLAGFARLSEGRMERKLNWPRDALMAKIRKRLGRWTG